MKVYLLMRGEWLSREWQERVVGVFSTRERALVAMGSLPQHWVEAWAVQ